MQEVDKTHSAEGQEFLILQGRGPLEPLDQSGVRSAIYLTKMFWSLGVEWLGEGKVLRRRPAFGGCSGQVTE